MLQVKGGIVNQIVPGITSVSHHLYNPLLSAVPNCSAGAATPTDPTDDCGVGQAVAFFKASIPTLVDGITGSIAQTLLANISVPSAGCDPAKPTLIRGAGALAAGGSDLQVGTGKLLAGAGQLDGGAGQLSDGANKLADGLGSAADGSGLLAGGLEKAADGAPALEDGAQRLSDEGTSKLVQAGKSTAQTYGELYAVIEAGAERADSEKMAFGAPEGALGLTAYTYEIRRSFRSASQDHLIDN